MTVLQLIEILHNHPPDMRVVVNGYEGGYDDLSPRQIVHVKITLHTGKTEWEGKHDDASYMTGSESDYDTVDALVLRRVS